MSDQREAAQAVVRALRRTVERLNNGEVEGLESWRGDFKDIDGLARVVFENRADGRRLVLRQEGDSFSVNFFVGATCDWNDNGTTPAQVVDIIQRTLN